MKADERDRDEEAKWMRQQRATPRQRWRKVQREMGDLDNSHDYRLNGGCVS